MTNKMINRIIERLEDMNTGSGFPDGSVSNEAYREGYTTMKNHALSIVREEYKNNGWTPVSERLPNEDECNRYDKNDPCHRQFMCTIKIGDNDKQVRELYLSPIFGWKYGPSDYNKYVIAWQQLPDTYKGSE